MLGQLKNVMNMIINLPLHYHMSWTINEFQICNYNKMNIAPTINFSENMAIKHTTLSFSRTMYNFRKLTQYRQLHR
jgi:hypothetical protein